MFEGMANAVKELRELAKALTDLGIDRNIAQAATRGAVTEVASLHYKPEVAAAHAFGSATRTQAALERGALVNASEGLSYTEPMGNVYQQLPRSQRPVTIVAPIQDAQAGNMNRGRWTEIKPLQLKSGQKRSKS